MLHRVTRPHHGCCSNMLPTGVYKRFGNVTGDVCETAGLCCVLPDLPRCIYYQPVGCCTTETFHWTLDFQKCDSVLTRSCARCFFVTFILYKHIYVASEAKHQQKNILPSYFQCLCFYRICKSAREIVVKKLYLHIKVKVPETIYLCYSSRQVDCCMLLHEDSALVYLKWLQEIFSGFYSKDGFSGPKDH